MFCNIIGNLSKHLISKKFPVKSIAMSPYYFLPIVVAVLNPPPLTAASHSTGWWTNWHPRPHNIVIIFKLSEREGWNIFQTQRVGQRILLLLKLRLLWFPSKEKGFYLWKFPLFWHLWAWFWFWKTQNIIEDKERSNSLQMLFSDI